MNNKKQHANRKVRRDRRVRIRSIRRNPPDIKKLAAALIQLAQAQAEADAEAEHARKAAARQRRADRAEHEDDKTQATNPAGDQA